MPEQQGHCLILRLYPPRAEFSTQTEAGRCALSGSKMVEMLASTMPALLHVALALANGTSGELKMVKEPLTHLPAHWRFATHLETLGTIVRAPGLVNVRA